MRWVASLARLFWVLLHEQLDRLQEGDRFYYIPRLENFDFYQNFVEDQTFAGIVARNTGLTGLGEAIFVAADANSYRGTRRYPGRAGGGRNRKRAVDGTPEPVVEDEDELANRWQLRTRSSAPRAMTC